MRGARRPLGGLRLGLGRLGPGKLRVGREGLRRLAIATSTAAAVLLSLSIAAAAAPTPSDPPDPLVLQESLNGRVQCTSPDGTCTIVNLYGQGGNPAASASLVAPGQTHTTTVSLRNAGTLTGSALTLSAGACTAQLCGTLTVTISCATGTTTFNFGPATLDDFAASGTHTLVTNLAPGAATTCTFSLTYPFAAPGLVSASSVQAVTWTLTAAEAPPTTAPPTSAPSTAAPSTSAPSTSAPPTTAPPTSAPSTVAPSTTGPSTAAPAQSTPGAPPSTAAPPSPSGALAATGFDAEAPAIAGLVLLVIGAVLFWLSRRRERAER